MSREDKLREILNDTAKEYPAHKVIRAHGCHGWFICSDNLEQEAANQNPDKKSFNEMLSALQDVIRNRQKTGGW